LFPVCRLPPAAFFPAFIPAFSPPSPRLLPCLLPCLLPAFPPPPSPSQADETYSLDHDVSLAKGINGVLEVHGLSDINRDGKLSEFEYMLYAHLLGGGEGEAAQGTTFARTYRHELQNGFVNEVRVNAAPRDRPHVHVRAPQ
jgi:hypothetical protein